MLDELGLQLAAKLTELPEANQKVAQPGVAPKTSPLAEGGDMDAADADLMARLDRLRREWETGYTSYYIV